ncbi:AbrB/MazE/SpoVT family DNA-binding domain-containing protein [Asanoa sp. NPDC049518]|uniref:AbrB/MazE/SpoVT family DNA-binding domain-containing protein n=1 Tax=unclassified Asanoa TaxID=2685164 RepID=UPI00342C61B6
MAALAPEATWHTDSVYALTPVDRSGRIADRGIVAVLGWPPGTRLDARERAGLFTVHAPGDGRCRIDSRGHLILALALRRWCRLGAGDRLLLTADRRAGVLKGYPLPVLDRLLAAASSAGEGGGLE